MPFTTFGENFALFDTTAVENLFIQEYMLRAPGTHVKVYLYGLMLCYHPSENMSLARMARDLDISEDDVFSIYQYWERQGLVRRVSDRPPRYVYNNLKHLQLMSGSEQESVYRYKDFNETLHNLFEKKRKLYDQDYRRVYEWIEVLGLPETVVIMLIRHLIDRYGVRFSFDKAEKMAREWSEMGVKTIEDAEQQALISKQQEDDLQRVLRRLGQRRKPSEDEQALFRKWTGEWGFSLPAILEACKETTKGTPSMAYLNGILARQHQMGLHDAAEITDRLNQEQEVRQPVKAVFTALGRRAMQPSEEDMRWYQAHREQGFTHEAVELAARVAHHNGANGLAAVDQRLAAWQALGLFDRPQIEAYLQAVKRDNQQLEALFAACGEQRRPTAQDRRLLSKWRDAWQMPLEVCLVAGERAAFANQKMPFIDAILDAWQSKQIRTVEAARAEAAQHGAQGGPGQQAQAARPVREVAQHRYEQRSYSPEELEALVFDPFAAQETEESP